MSQKKPFTLAESVVKPCLEIVAQEIHGGATAVTKVQKLALSDNTMQRRCSLIAASLKEIVLAKLLLAPFFGLQLDEMTYITSKAQLIVYVRFPNTERMKIVDHYLFCLPIGIDTTALSKFSKLDNYFSEHEVMWSKCKSVSTDGARAMVGVRSGVRRRRRLKGIHSRPDTNRTGAEGLSFYYPRLLHCLDQMLAVMSLNQHRVSSSKTVRPRAPCGARCIGHTVSTWFAVCSEAPHSQFGEGARPHLCMDE